MEYAESISVTLAMQQKEKTSKRDLTVPQPNEHESKGCSMLHVIRLGTSLFPSIKNVETTVDAAQVHVLFS